jgi:hypothetical protein
MRTLPTAISISCLMLPAALPVSAQPEISIYRLQAENESGVRDGTCFVIRREKRPEGTFLLLVTSARLFERESRRRARVFVDRSTPVEIGPDAIATPYGNMRDVAVLKATVEDAAAAALPVVFDPVSSGTPFVVSGLRPDGSLALVAQHVRFSATRTVIGDRSTEPLAGCQGAPAIVGGAAFGIVSECGPDRVPEITPLSVSRHFLLRMAPELGDEGPEVSSDRP